MLLPWHGGAAGSADDPFAFFAPWLTISNADRLRLERGDVVVRTLPAEDGQLAIFAAARLQAPPDALLAWTAAIGELKRGPFVLAVRRFSDPPVLEDLDALTLDEGDLDALRRCEAGSCGVKLAAPEIASLRRAIGDAGASWRAAAQQEFRRLLLARVNLYRAEGLVGLPPYADRGRLVSPRETFASLMTHSPYLSTRLPDFAAALTDHAATAADQSFFYWSKERYGAGKNVITVTHVQMLRAPSGVAVPAALVAGKQLFASHYTDGALGLTTVVCGRADGACYLAYLNRTQTDVLGGLFGVFKRAIVEQRIESETPTILRELRRRLESGPPVVNGENFR